MSCTNCDNTEIHENAVGVGFTLTLLGSDSAARDISSATTKQMWFQDPNGTNYTKTASFVTDGTDGQIRYISESGFLTPPGKWRLQAYIILPSGSFPSAIQPFKVKANLQ
jgi:hypothetical protein